MNYSNLRRRVHLLFEAGIFLKGLDSLIEVVAGTLLAVLNLQTINNIIFTVFGDELTEKPRDPIIRILFHGFNGLSASSQSFWALILLASGITKLFLVLGLYYEKIWVYPTAAIIFTFFAAYEIHHLIHFPSLALCAFALFDILFIILIVNEYQYKMTNSAK